MAIYTVFESTNMGSTHYAERIFDAVATEDIENGTFGYLDGLAEGEAVIYNFKKGTKEGLKAGDIVVADNPEWDADTSKITNQRKDKFIIKAGTPFRVRVVKKNDEFAVSAEGFTAETQEKVVGTDGNPVDFATKKVYVGIDATTGKLVASDAESEGAMTGQVMRKRITGGKLVTPVRSYGYSREMYEVKVTALA